MKTDDIVNAKTNAELLNKLMNFRAKEYLPSMFDLYNGYKIWMIRADGEQDKAGFIINIEDFGSVVTETYTGSPYSMVLSNSNMHFEKRLIFSIHDSPYIGRYYMFLGVFEIDLSSNMKIHKWVKVADNYNFPKFKN